MESGKMNKFLENIFKILVVLIILVCPITIFIVFVTFDKEVAVAYSEASLLSTGMTIIGAAITVWTGLNIANLVNKKDLEKLQETINKQSDDLKELQIGTKKQLGKLEKLQNDTEEQSDEVEKMNIKMTELQNNYNSLFLQELLKTQKDIVSLYFYEQFNIFFSKRKNDIVKSPLLIKIEYNFAEVYSLHNFGYDVDELLILKANDGLKEIEEYESEEQADGLVKQYLDYRKGEFNYYKGYREKSMEEAYDILIDAAEAYLKFAEAIGIQLEFNEDEYEKISNYTGNFVDMACYLAGAIGDAYSQIVHICEKKEAFQTKREFVTKKEIITCAQKAIYFCKCAAEWSKNKSCENEVFFRNLGVAYERLDRMNEIFLEHKKQIMDNYHYAFQIMHSDCDIFEKRKQNIYHTILSYYEKIFKNAFSEFDNGCLTYKETKDLSFLDDEKVKTKYINEIKNMIYKIKETNNGNIDVNALREYVIIARSGVEHNPHYTLRISLLGLAYTYVIFLLKADDVTARRIFPKSLEYYIEEIEKLISYLDIVDMRDDYANELRLRHKGIIGI